MSNKQSNARFRRPVLSGRWPLAAAAALLCFAATPVPAQAPVTAQPLAQLTITVQRSAPAEVVSLHAATVASQLSAAVDTLPLLLGDRVAAGALLATLDCADSQLALAQAKAEIAALEANRALASRQLERLSTLRASDNAAEEEINQKQAELEVTRARLSAQNIAIQSAQRAVDKCQIAAPFAGVVTAIHSAKGNFVTPGSPIVSLVDIENTELSARLSAAEAAQLAAARQLTFDYQGRRHAVSIRATVQVVDAVTQTRIMRLRFDGAQADEQVNEPDNDQADEQANDQAAQQTAQQTGEPPLPGAHGRLRWTLPGKILPAALAVSRGEQRGVFILAAAETPESGAQTVARFVPAPGAGPGQPLTVDLPDDAQVVVDGRHGLRDGDAVLPQ